MIKFNLTTSEHEGFKLTTQAESEEEVKLLEGLVQALIAKIEKISVQIGMPDYEEEVTGEYITPVPPSKSLSS